VRQLLLHYLRAASLGLPALLRVSFTWGFETWYCRTSAELPAEIRRCYLVIKRSTRRTTTGRLIFNMICFGRERWSLAITALKLNRYGIGRNAGTASGHRLLISWGTAASLQQKTNVWWANYQSLLKLGINRAFGGKTILMQDSRGCGRCFNTRVSNSSRLPAYLLKNCWRASQVLLFTKAQPSSIVGKPTVQLTVS
jgi:hypothetical protein